MVVEVFKEEIRLDIIEIPEEMIPEFCKQCEERFGVKPDRCAFPQRDYKGYHVTLMIDSSERHQFHDFLFKFCKDNNLLFSIHNTQALI